MHLTVRNQTVGMSTKSGTQPARLAELAQVRLEAEQAAYNLRLNAALFYALTEQAPIGVYVVDDQFRLQRINAQGLPVFAKVPSPIGRDFGEIMTILWGPELAADIIAIFRNTLATGNGMWRPVFPTAAGTWKRKSPTPGKCSASRCPAGGTGRFVISATLPTR